jgi:6-phosphogluconate dehydrogenase
LFPDGPKLDGVHGVVLGHFCEAIRHFWEKFRNNFQAYCTGLDNLKGYKEIGDFVQSLEKPRCAECFSMVETSDCDAYHNLWPVLLKHFQSVDAMVCSRIIMLVKAGAPVDMTIEGLMDHLEEGDIIIDGGNEWYENSERRMESVGEKGVRYIAMGVSGGEEGARNGEIRACCLNT